MFTSDVHAPRLYSNLKGILESTVAKEHTLSHDEVACSTRSHCSCLRHSYSSLRTENLSVPLPVKSNSSSSKDTMAVAMGVHSEHSIDQSTGSDEEDLVLPWEQP